MKTSPYYWLKSFASAELSARLLNDPNPLFEAALSGRGNQHLWSLAADYASLHKMDLPLSRCIQMDYTHQFQGLEAVFINIFPCLQLSSAPVHLAAIRRSGESMCRVFRLYYPSQANLYLSEFCLGEKKIRKGALPAYREAISLVFSFTLGTRFMKGAKPPIKQHQINTPPGNLKQEANSI